MSPIKVLYICQEITPYLPETEISTICRQLPQAIQEQSCEIRTFMPKFGCINERRNQLHEVIRLSGMNLIIDDNDHQLLIKVASIQSARMQVYFIDNEDFFQRKFTTTDAQGNEFPDNDVRSIFFARSVIETVRKLRWTPDVIHCHGWMSAFAPLYIKKAYNDDPFFKNAKVVYSLYNDEFKQGFDASSIGNKILFDNITPADFSELDNCADYASLTRLALRHSDGIIQESQEIRPDIAQWVKDSQKPFVLGGSDNRYAHYLDFYKTLLESV